MNKDDMRRQRGGQSVSRFKNDDDYNQWCMSRLHAYLCDYLPVGMTLRPAPEGVYDFDAQLELAHKSKLRLEYKFDRYPPINAALEAMARDRGPDPQLGYIFKQGYDWLTYVYGEHDVIYFLRAAAVRAYVFSNWRESQSNFGATHCKNDNASQSASWCLLVPLNKMLRRLGPNNVRKIQLPQGMLSSDGPIPRNNVARELGLKAASVLGELLNMKPGAAWKPTASIHIRGLVEHLMTKNGRRRNYGGKSHEVEGSRLLDIDWIAMAHDGGYLRIEPMSKAA